MPKPTNKNPARLGGEPLLDPFLERGREILECRYPIIAGAMTWISYHKLVAAVCEAGGFGQLAGGNAPAEVVRDEILVTRGVTTKVGGSRCGWTCARGLRSGRAHWSRVIECATAAGSPRSRPCTDFSSGALRSGEQ